MIPTILDYTIETVLNKSNSFNSKEEKTIFSKINDHKWFVSEQLGRDVGLFVAATDYFFNIHKLPSMP